MFSKRVAIALTLLFSFAAIPAFAEGLALGYGQNLPTETVNGKTYKVLARGVLAPGQSTQLSGVRFESNAFARIVGIGEGPGSDLDIYVNDPATGNIGSDTLRDNFPIVEWQTGNGLFSRNTADVNIRNAGSGYCTYVILANW